MPKKKAAKSTAKKTREPLSRERVLQTAVRLADEIGLDSLSMRRLGQELGVEAMSLYKHVANKDAILDGIVDIVVGEIAVPRPGEPWRAEMRRRAVSAHEVLLAHPWASSLIESRKELGPNRLHYFNAMIGTLRQAGFPISLAYKTFMTLDAYLYGFILQELSWEFEKDERAEVVEEIGPQVSPDQYPYLIEMMQYVLGADATMSAVDYAAEFEFGLTLLLDGLERTLHEEGNGAAE